MESASRLLQLAHERAKSAELPYQGCLLPREAYQLLQADPRARLIDIRTEAELAWVGFVPDSLQIEWSSWPEGGQNPHFVAELRKAVPDSDTPVLFLCRSGARSHRAAEVAASAGYTKAINVLEGFEGDRDANFHRGKVGGWRLAGLPWEQH